MKGSERLGLLEGVPAFARLPEGTLEELSGLLREEPYSAGAVVVAEGDRGDRLYLISGDHAEVSAAGSKGTVPLATLGPGEMFGEIALLEPGGKRQATVTATTDLLTLSLSAPAFHRVLDAYPEAPEGVKPASGVLESAIRPTRVQRTTALTRRILEWQDSVPGVDAPITHLYQSGVRLLYTWPDQILLAAVAHGVSGGAQGSERQDGCGYDDRGSPFSRGPSVGNVRAGASASELPPGSIPAGSSVSGAPNQAPAASNIL